MLYTIVEDFGPELGEAWFNYNEWRGLDFSRFDSLDGILRPSLFDPTTDEDWNHVVCEDFALSHLTDFLYAQKKHRKIGSGSLVAFSYENHDETHKRFVGYDIIDGYCDVSLLTNWGNDLDFINQALGSNALLPRIQQAQTIHQQLLKDHSDDNHVPGSKIISVYSTPVNL